MQSKIARFNIIRVLGEGSQGIVHLAQDPLLERKVAIKTLHPVAGMQTEQFNELLMDEAKVISKMTHPNIVSIFEAGEEGGLPFLVIEYVKGRTLSDVIKSKEYQKIPDALSLFKPICQGMLHSHKNKVIHGDLKPANIIIDDENVPKIMDFGIARLLSSQKNTDKLYGTPRYMPPEYLQHRDVSQANDVYALGLILYEMLTGRVAIEGKDIKQIIYNVFNSKIILPSNLVEDVGVLFEHIVLKACDKNIKNRFKSMSEMLSAIEAYEDKSKSLSINSSSKAQSAAITFLIRKIKRQQDFPALSETLVKINTLVDKEDTNSAELANVIIEDFALTNKILKLVNSAYYRTTKIEVKTISQAVLILGFDEIRSVAISLILIDHLHNKSKAGKLRSHIVSSIYSGILTKDLSLEVDYKEHEEAFLSGTFHQLGEMLTLYYFHEEADEIEKLIVEENLTKEQASNKILGVSYQILGIAIAKEWKLPQYIINNITPYKTANKKTNFELNNYDKLKAITSLSNELADALNNKSNDNWRISAVKVWKSFAGELGLDDDSLIKLANQARKNLIEVNHIFNIDLSHSEVINKVEKWSIEESAEENKDVDRTLVAGDKFDVDKTQVYNEDSSLQEHVVETSVKKLPTAEILHTAELEITKEIAENNNLSQIFTIYMQAVSEALELERVIICLYNNKNKEMCARMGLGITDQFLNEFTFSLKRPIKNLFQVASVKGVDVYINDTEEYEKKTTLPAWYRQVIDSETFMLFPVTYNRKPFALFYLDKNKKNELLIGQKHLKKLQALRALCLKSIEQRYMVK
ncbi:MAG: HDOD domain-containing protein [Pseudomonadota bacterium]